MAFAEINGHRIHYIDSGGAGLAVLFSHGFSLDHTMFDAQVEALAGRYRCITWDARGHGMTHCKGDFTMWDSARDCIGLLDVLGIETAALVGLSQGGFASMRAAMTDPARVRALVLMDTAARGFDAPTRAGYQAMRDSWVTDGPVGETSAVMATLMFGPGYDASIWVARWRARPPEDWEGGWSPLLDRDDVFSRLGEIGCPTLVIHGDADGAFDVAVAREMAEAIPGARLEIIDGGPHVPTVTHAPAVNLALGRFLDQHA
ncbi:MAG: hydrolase, alpha/beta fold family [Caulobacteraceae bacterium]|nr:hydrolase, alpha/beta fold family [Caulobacteraceae bacterium]